MKLKLNGFREWTVFLFAVVAFTAGICFAYQSIIDRVGTTEKVVAKAVDKVEILDTAVTEMKKDIFYIRGDMGKALDGIETLKWGIGLTDKRPVRNEPNR